MPGPFPSSAVCGSLVCGVAFGGVLLFVVGVFVVGFVIRSREVTAGGDVAGILGGQGAGGLGGDRGTYLGLVVGHGVTARCGEQVGCGAGNGGGGGGRKEATWQQLHAVSSFGWGRARPGPRVGYIYLSPLYKQAFMAHLARALVAILLAVGSILMY